MRRPAFETSTGVRRLADASAGFPESESPARMQPDADVDVAESTESGTGLDEPWRVLLYNDDVHSFEEVIFQVVKATGKSTVEAERLVWQAHLKGQSRVFEGTMQDCLSVQHVLREIALITEIRG